MVFLGPKRRGGCLFWAFFIKKSVLLYEILREKFQFWGFIHVKNAEKRFFTPNTVQKSARLLERLFNVTRSFDYEPTVLRSG